MDIRRHGEMIPLLETGSDTASVDTGFSEIDDTPLSMEDLLHEASSDKPLTIGDLTDNHPKCLQTENTVLRDNQKRQGRCRKMYYKTSSVERDSGYPHFSDCSTLYSRIPSINSLPDDYTDKMRFFNWRQNVNRTILHKMSEGNNRLTDLFDKYSSASESFITRTITSPGTIREENENGYNSRMSQLSDTNFIFYGIPRAKLN